MSTKRLDPARINEEEIPAILAAVEGKKWAWLMSKANAKGWFNGHILAYCCNDFKLLVDSFTKYAKEKAE